MNIGLDDLTFPDEWVKSALVLALTCTTLVIGLFFFINRRAKRSYFTLWIVAWLFFAVFLASSIGLLDGPDNLLLSMVRRIGLGVSALFMFWGSFQLSHQPRSIRELKWCVMLVLLWNCVATFQGDGRLWTTMPLFALLGGAGLYTGTVYWSQRKNHQGGAILGLGFILWGAHLLVFPIVDQSPALTTCAYVLSSALALMIPIGLVVDQELAIADRNYRSLFDSSSDAVFLVDVRTMTILEANTAAQHLTRRHATDLVGASFHTVCAALTDGKAGTADNQRLFQSLFKPFSEIQVTRADGTPVACEGETMIVAWRDRPAMQVNLRDLGARKKSTEQQQRADRQAALGQLVAGVAHELNNPLGVISGCSQLLAKRQDLDEATRQELQRIRTHSDRATRIVRDLLAYARPRPPERVAVDINQLVTSVMQTLAPELVAAVACVDLHLSPKPLLTNADVNQIELVLIHLLSNAIQAVADRPGPRWVTVVTEETVSSVRIKVADNGAGVAPEVVQRIFDPFYTTRPVGKGKGLGLTIANAIVNEHRGTLWVESSPAKGATFCVDLPPLENEPIAPANGLVQRVEPVAAQNRVRSLLVVDDEPGMVAVLEATLAGDGYRVDTAADGREALQKISSGQYDLILTDLRMPVMTGNELYEALARHRSPLAKRMIFVTGDTVSTDTRTFLESTGNHWVSKPFRLAEITDTVAAALQRN